MVRNVIWIKFFAIVIVTNALPQRCDKGSKVCNKLEKDDPIFAGQRCKVPADCKGSIRNEYFSVLKNESFWVSDPYNPYCSKWGYCISYNLFGEEGPGQSKGAVEDGTRGQCRGKNTVHNIS